LKIYQQKSVGLNTTYKETSKHARRSILQIRNANYNKTGLTTPKTIVKQHRLSIEVKTHSKIFTVTNLSNGNFIN